VLSVRRVRRRGCARGGDEKVEEVAGDVGAALVADAVIAGRSGIGVGIGAAAVAT